MEDEFEEDLFGMGKENEALENRLRRRSHLSFPRSRPISYPPCFSFSSFDTPLYLKGSLMDRKPQKLIEPICEEVSARIGRKVKFADEAGKQLASYMEIPNKLDRFGFRSLTNINSVFEEAMGKDITEIEQVFDNAFSAKSEVFQKRYSMDAGKEGADSGLGCKRKYTVQSHVSFPKEKFPRGQTAVSTESRKPSLLTTTILPSDTTFHCSLQTKMRKNSTDECLIGETDLKMNSFRQPQPFKAEASLPGAICEEQISSESRTNLYPFSSETTSLQRDITPGDDREENNYKSSILTTKRIGVSGENIPSSNVSVKHEVPIFHQRKASQLKMRDRCMPNATNEKCLKKRVNSSDRIFEELFKKLHSAGQSSESSSDSSPEPMISPPRYNQTPIPVHHNKLTEVQPLGQISGVNLSTTSSVCDQSLCEKATCSTLMNNNLGSQNTIAEGETCRSSKDTSNEELSFTLVIEKDTSEVNKTCTQSGEDPGVDVDYTLPYSSTSPVESSRANLMTSSFDENPNISFTIISPTPSVSDVAVVFNTENHMQNTGKQKGKRLSPEVDSNNFQSLASPLKATDDVKAEGDFIQDTNAAIVDILSVFDEVSFPDFKDASGSSIEQEEASTENPSLGEMSTAVASDRNRECNMRQMLGVNYGSESGYGTHSFISDDFINEDSLSVGTSAFELDDVFEEDLSGESDPQKDTDLSSVLLVIPEVPNETYNTSDNQPEKHGYISGIIDTGTSGCDNGTTSLNIQEECLGTSLTSSTDSTLLSSHLEVSAPIVQTELLGKGPVQTVRNTEQTYCTDNSEKMDYVRSKLVSSQGNTKNVIGQLQNGSSSSDTSCDSINKVYLDNTQTSNTSSDDVIKAEHRVKQEMEDSQVITNRKDQLETTPSLIHHENLPPSMNEPIPNSNIADLYNDAEVTCKNQDFQFSAGSPQRQNSSNPNPVFPDVLDKSQDLGMDISVTMQNESEHVTSNTSSHHRNSSEDSLESSDMEFYLPRDIGRTIVDCMFRKKRVLDPSDSDSSEGNGSLRKLKVQERKKCKTKKPESNENPSKHQQHSCRRALQTCDSGEESDLESFSSDSSQVTSDTLLALQKVNKRATMVSVQKHSPIQIADTNSEYESIETPSVSSEESCKGHPDSSFSPGRDCRKRMPSQNHSSEISDNNSTQRNDKSQSLSLNHKAANRSNYNTVTSVSTLSKCETLPKACPLEEEAIEQECHASCSTIQSDGSTIDKQLGNSSDTDSDNKLQHMASRNLKKKNAEKTCLSDMMLKTDTVEVSEIGLPFDSPSKPSSNESESSSTDFENETYTKIEDVRNLLRERPILSQSGSGISADDSSEHDSTSTDNILVDSSEGKKSFKLCQQDSISDNDLNVTVIITSEGKLIVQDEGR